MFENVIGKKIISFKPLLKNLTKSSELRNAVVHADWENMNEKGYTFVKMYCNHNGMHQQYWQFTPESLEKAIDFIDDTYLQFDGFLEEYYNYSDPNS